MLEQEIKGLVKAIKTDYINSCTIYGRDALTV